MKKVKGDLLDLALKDHFDVIVHGCNCFNTMGAGIAAQIKKLFPSAYEADCETIKGDTSKLGDYTQSYVHTANGGFTIVNAYTQYKYWGRGPHVDYEAISSVFSRVKREFAGKRIGYPMIGAGLAGGDWNIIQNIISEELDKEDHTLVVYDPCGR